MKKILSTLLLAASLTSAQAQEVKIVSGKVRIPRWCSPRA